MRHNLCMTRVLRKGQGVKSALALFLLILSIASPQNARAAGGQHGVGLGLGEVLLMGDFAKNFDNSIGFHGLYNYDASALFGLLVEVTYGSFSGGAANANSLSIMGLTPHLKINLAYIDKLIVYSLVGFGLYKVSEKIGTIDAGVTTLGFDMGAGVNLALDQHILFGTQLAFSNIFGKTDSATVTSTSPGLSVGGTYIGLFLNFIYVF